MLVGESAHGGVLAHVDRRAHRALAVDKVGEGEGEVAALRLLRPVERLDEPFAQSEKMATSLVVS